MLEPKGLFDVAAPRVEDYDLLVRVSRLGGIVLVGRTVLGHRQHGGQSSRQHRQMYRSERYVRRKLLLAPENTPEQRRIARYARWHRCHEQLRWAKADLKERRFERAARNLHQATRHYARFAQDLALSLARYDIRPALGRAGR